MNLYFTRHGESEWNVLKQFQGQCESPLTAKGIEQAESLRKRINTVTFSRVLCSPLGRARQTAEILARDSGLSPEADPRIIEENLGVMEGMRFQEIPKELLDVFYEDPAHFDAHGEGHTAAFERVSDLMRELEARNENVLLVAHSLITRLIRLYILKLPISEMMKVNTPGCGYCEARFTDGKWELLSFGDIRCRNPLYDPEKFCYFGSPEPVRNVPEDVVLTPFAEEASAYAHDPVNITVAVNGFVEDDGTAEGFLYQIPMSEKQTAALERNALPFRLIGSAPRMEKEGRLFL